MITIHLKRFLFGILQIFHARCIGPSWVSRMIGSNNYELDIPWDFGLSLVVKDKDLIYFRVLINSLTIIPGPSSFTTVDAQYFLVYCHHHHRGEIKQRM